MESNPYRDLFADKDYAIAPGIIETFGDDPSLPERVREVVVRAAAEAELEPGDYEVWYNDDQMLAFPKRLNPPGTPGPFIDLT